MKRTLKDLDNIAGETFKIMIKDFSKGYVNKNVITSTYFLRQEAIKNIKKLEGILGRCSCGDKIVAAEHFEEESYGIICNSFSSLKKGVDDEFDEDEYFKWEDQDHTNTCDFSDEIKERLVIIAWIKEFFNITEADLKD